MKQPRMMNQRRFKYLSWKPKNSKYWKGNLLLNDIQRRSVVKDLLRNPKAQSIYSTIQDFDKKGEVLGCYVYADMDGASALDDVRECVTKICNELGSYPLVYYSGLKGFHIIINYYIKHPLCHLIAKDIMQTFSQGFSLDLKVYSGRRLFRVPNTFHTKGERYKTSLSRGELFTLGEEDIRWLSESPGKADPFTTIPGKGITVLKELEAKSIEKLKDRPPVRTTTDFNSGEWREELTPCLRHLIENEPVEGEVNASLFILARFFKWLGVPVAEALDIILAQDHYYKRQQTERDVIKVLDSTYQSGTFSKVGCKYEPERTILLKHCKVICHYNEEKLWFKRGG